MCNRFYGFLIDQKLRQLDLFNYLKVAEKYGKIHYDATEVFDKDGNIIDKDKVNNGCGVSVDIDPVFVSVKDDDGTESCVVFYDNIFILFSVNADLSDRIVQIYIKRPEDEWKVPVKEDGSGLDLLNPCNAKVEVYVNYDVSVCKLNRRLSRCEGEEYRSGKWNNKFYKMFNSFINKVEGYTEINQIKQAYGK